VSAIRSAEGAETIAWNTSNHAVARISTLGHATAMSTGTVNIQAMIGTVEASPWTLTVVAAAQPPSPDITVISTINGPTVTLPAWVRACLRQYVYCHRITARLVGWLPATISSRHARKCQASDKSIEAASGVESLCV
jgi:hypothetical protein